MESPVESCPTASAPPAAHAALSYKMSERLKPEKKVCEQAAVCLLMPHIRRRDI